MTNSFDFQVFDMFIAAFENQQFGHPAHQRDTEQPGAGCFK